MSSSEKDQLLNEIDQLESENMQVLTAGSLGVLCCGLVHELNNPLALIVGNINFLEKRLAEPDKLDDKIEKYLVNAKTAAERIKKTINQVRDLQKKLTQNLDQSGEFKADIATNEILDVIETFFTSGGVELKKRIQQGIVIDGGKEKFQQIILHLLANAREALSMNSINEEKWIEVNVFTSKQTINIEIVDSLCNYNDGHEDDIFKAFYTGKEALSRRGKALILARKFAEEFAGSIVAEKTEGGALRFLVELPLQASKANAFVVQQQVDLPLVLENIKRVEVIQDVTVAKKRIREVKDCDIFVDYKVGSISGLKFIADAKSENLAGRFILLLNKEVSSLDEATREKLSHLVDGVLFKGNQPLSQDQLGVQSFSLKTS